MINLLMCAVITKANILELTNLSRQENKVAILLENKQLNLAAQNKAVDIYTKKYWSHTAPNGKTPWDFIIAAGYNYITAGENLAVNFKLFASADFENVAGEHRYFFLLLQDKVARHFHYR